MKCSKTDCPNDAAWHVIIEAKPAPPAEGVALGATTMRLCESCSKLATLDEMVDVQSWDVLAKEFEALGRPAPDRRYSRLIFEPIS